MPMETIEPIKFDKSEWLTIGQMIDLLQLDQVAECENKEFYVRANERTMSVFVGLEALESGNGKMFQLTPLFRSLKWRILPKFVSFDEALIAFSKGKKIWCEYQGNRDWFSKDLCHEQREVAPSFGEMRFGKWTIEED
jgi:hypothetical protein